MNAIALDSLSPALERGFLMRLVNQGCRFLLRSLFGIGVVLLAGGPALGAEQDNSSEPKRTSEPDSVVKSFDKNVKITVTDDFYIVVSDGIPTHKTGTFPNRTNPNTIRKQNYRFAIPRVPKRSGKPVPTPFGPIGVAINGIPFYNPYNAEGRDAVLGPFAEVFDSCCGHPDPMGRYHYHKYPECIKSPFKDPVGKHSPLIGYAFDGYAVYGPNGDDGTPPSNLDECNGHEDAGRGYHYHVTDKYPYLIGAYRGVPAARNIDRPRFAGRNGPFQGPGPGGPPPHPLQIALDKDRDGAISPDEITQAPAALKSLDKNHDGSLSPAELRPAGGGPRGPEGPEGSGEPPPGSRRLDPSPEGRGPDGPPPGERPGGPPPSEGFGGRRPVGPPLHPIHMALDKNRDGKISAKEIEDSPQALKTLDRDKDGTLSLEELRPRGPRPGGPPGGPGGPRRGPGPGAGGDGPPPFEGPVREGDGPPPPPESV